jgi:predicted type IV restriction endonuclease
MVQTISATSITLYDLESKFDLQLLDDESFFREWRDNLPEITDLEKQQLDRVKASYLNLVKYSMLEEVVKMVVVSPLLNLAGYYLSPFHIATEETVEISDEDEGVVIKGKIDVLVVKNQLWVLVIESKRASYSLEVAIPQILTYMMSSPNVDSPMFGMITTGREFQFIKLVKEGTPKYALSNSYDIRDHGNELYGVLSVLKQFAQMMVG